MPGPSATPQPIPAQGYPMPPEGYHRETAADGSLWFIPDGHSVFDYPITAGALPSQNPAPPKPPPAPPKQTPSGPRPTQATVYDTNKIQPPPPGFHTEQDTSGTFWYVPDGHHLADYDTSITPGATDNPTSINGLDPTRPQTSSPGMGTIYGQLPDAPQGGTVGPFAPANNVFTYTANQPYYNVRIWRVSEVFGNNAGGEWQVLSAGGTDTHLVGEYVTSVSTSHTMSNPAGQFSIGLLPIRLQLATGGPTRTWAELLRPMDYIEITMARTRRYKDLPDKDIRDLMLQMNTDVPFVVLRGFITNVRVVDAVDTGTGQPQRRVMVNGMNFHKLWLEYSMYLLAENMENYQAKYGNIFTQQNNGGFMSPAEFMGTLYGAIFRPQLAGLAKTIPDVLRHGIYCDVPSGDSGYKMMPQMFVANATLGPLDTIMRQYATVPYTEFYTYDEPWPNGKPITEWRWSPYTDRANRFPLPSHILSKPQIRVLRGYEISEHDIGNSDNDALTYYYATMTQSFANPSQMPKTQVHGYLDVDKLRVYGFRPYEPPWPWTNDKPVPDMAVATDPNIWGAIVARLTNWLASVFEHNIDNMEGQIVCNGRPDIHIGEYLDVPEAGYRYYVEGVDNNIVVGQSFTTSLTVTRGLPMRDLPNWTLPSDWRYDSTKAAGQPELGGIDPTLYPDYLSGGTHFVAPPSSTGAPMTGGLPAPNPRPDNYSPDNLPGGTINTRK
jgi:hypothetical protein